MIVNLCLILLIILFKLEILFFFYLRYVYIAFKSYLIRFFYASENITNTHKFISEISQTHKNIV